MNAHGELSRADPDAPAARYTTLVECERLVEHLDDPAWVILDCRFELGEPLAGVRAYEEAHIPGAAYVDLEQDLSAPPGPGTGRHPLPDPGALGRRLDELGVSHQSQVVGYDAAGGAIAARLWWLLRWLGHDAVAVLDGGIERWRGCGYPVTREASARGPGRLAGRPRPAIWVSSEEVEALAGDPATRILDAREPERFRGETEPIDPVAGHVPGAVNMPFRANLAADGRFLAPEVLRERYRAALGEVEPERAICMCGSGVTACHDLLAMEVAGLGGGRLYVGSWSEWVTDGRRPVVTGGS